MDKEIELKGRLTGSQKMHLVKLLDMFYKPSELAQQVGFEVRQVYRAYIPLGCPHEKDKQRHIWINGRKFREWYEETYPRLRIAEDEAFCLTCKKAVKLSSQTKKQKGRLHYWISICENCGRKISRIITREKLEQ